MTLSARERARYARQLLLPQLGEAGQARLLAARVHAPRGADASALSVASEYLERAGMRVVLESERDRPDTASECTLELSGLAPDEVARVAGEPALQEAARALVGALAAVDAVRAVVGFNGQPARAIPSLSVALEEA